MNFDDEYFMNLAIAEAEKAAAIGEVPVGAVAVKNGEPIAATFNLIETRKSALAHAEILLIQELNKILGDWRLDEITIYVTKEPCPMCAGAMVNSHLKRVVFGTLDKRSGACGSSAHNIANNSDMLWQIEITGGILEEKCTKNFKDFFVKIRQEKAKKKDE